jgi:hypothetical protein
MLIFGEELADDFTFIFRVTLALLLISGDFAEFTFIP